MNAQQRFELGVRMGAMKLGIEPYEYRAQVEAGLRWCWVHQTWEPVERFEPKRYWLNTRLNTCCVEGNRERSRENMRRLRARRRAVIA